MIFSFDGAIPYVHPSSYVHPQATIIGRVNIGPKVYVGPGARIRGDWGQIDIQEGCNVQENCIIHLFPNVNVTLEKNAHIGHGAILHGAQIKENVLVGMNAVIMDHAVIGEGSIIGALAFIKANAVIAPRSLMVGNPAKKIREVSDEMLAWKTSGTELYQQLPELMLSSELCDPLTEHPGVREIPDYAYETFKQKTKNEE